VTNMQDALPQNVLPFPQRRTPGASYPGERDLRGELARAMCADDAGDLEDLVLAMEPAGEDTGDQAGISHLRVLPLGASSGAFFPHTLTEDAPAAAAKLGLHDLEIMLQTRSEYEPEFAHILAARVRESGTRVRSVHTMEQLHRMWSPYPRRQADERALFQQAIDLAVIVGAKVLVWHGAQRAEVATDDGWERFIALTQDLAAACGAAGITLGIENVTACALHSVRNVARFATRLAEIGPAEHVGFVFDPFQAVESQANPFMILAAMGNRVVNVHISDASESNPALRHLPPGDGDLPWSALLRAIAGSGYQGPLMIEGPLGTDDVTIGRIRETFDPLYRNVFAFSPDGGGEAAELPVGVRKGIALFNAREFYEQHEEIEHEWHAERGEIRKLYQGILQIGVGFHHAIQGNHAGAVLLLTQGIDKVEAFVPVTMGIETGRLVEETRRALAGIEALGEAGIDRFDVSAIPVILMRDDA